MANYAPTLPLDQYSIRDIAKPIGISAYKLMETLPQQLAERLESEDLPLTPETDQLSQQVSL